MPVHELYPYLRVHDGRAAIAYYERALGARLLFQLLDPADGRIGHAELELAPGRILMLSDAYPEMGILAPVPGAPTAQALHLHVDDADAWVARMLEAGGTLVRPLSDQFYGERSGLVRDPFGHDWHVGHAIETVTPEEMQRRWNAMAGG